MSEPTVLIVGAGTFGTSTAFHLAETYEDPSRVTIIDDRCEPTPPPSAATTARASRDVNRIVRTDYPSRMYCDLACEAIHDWFWKGELAHHFHKVGWLMLGDEEGEEESTLSSRILQTFLDRGSTQASRLRPHEIETRWPILKPSSSSFPSSYFNPEAGWCDAASATSNLLSSASKKGIKRLTGRVTSLLLSVSPQGQKISGVRLADGSHITADKILLATGAWTSFLLSPIEDILQLPPSERIERQIQATGIPTAYYPLSDEQVARLVKPAPGLPVIVHAGGKGGEIIPPSPQNRVLKFADSRNLLVNTTITPSGQKISVPPGNDDDDEDQDHLLSPNSSLLNINNNSKRQEATKTEKKTVFNFSKVNPLFFPLPESELATFFLTNDNNERTPPPQPAQWKICWDAQTPTEDFLICKHPKLRNLFLATGGSFHAYKFLPNIGKYILNILNGKSNGSEMDKA